VNQVVREISVNGKKILLIGGDITERSVDAIPAKLLQVKVNVIVRLPSFKYNTFDATAKPMEA